jgi:hypothetical protein
MAIVETYYRIRIKDKWLDDLGGACEYRAHAAIFQTLEGAKVGRFRARKHFPRKAVKIIRVNVYG